MTKDEIKKENIQDRVLVITLARKVVNKYHHLETVQANIDVMHHQIKEFIELLIFYLKEDSFYSRKRKEERGLRNNIMIG